MELPARFGGMTLLRNLASGEGEETFLARPDGEETVGAEFVVKRLAPAIAENESTLRAV